MTRRSVEVVKRKRAASSRRRRCAPLCRRLCASVCDANLARPPTPRDPEIAFSLWLLFVVDVRPRPFEFTRPLPGLGRGPRCVSSGTFTVDLVRRPSTSPRSQPHWCSHALRWTPSCHLAAHYRSVGEVDNRLVFPLTLPHHFHSKVFVVKSFLSFTQTMRWVPSE